MADITTFYNNHGNLASYGYKIVREYNGFIYLIGFTNEDPNNRGGLIVKLNLKGEFIWKKIYNSSPTNTIQSFEGIVLCDNSDLVLSWRFGSTPCKFGLIRITTDGVVVWNEQYDMTEYHINNLLSGLPSTLIKLPSITTPDLGIGDMIIEDSFIVNSSNSSSGETFLLTIEIPLILNGETNATSKYAIFKVSSDGDLINSNFSNFNYNSHTFKDSNSIVLGSVIGLILTIDFNFNILNEYWYLYNLGGQERHLNILQIFYNNNSYYIFGRVTESTQPSVVYKNILFKTDIDSNGIPQQNVNAVLLDYNISTNAVFHKDFIYVSGPLLTSKFDYELNFLWKKNAGMTVKHPNLDTVVLELNGKVGRLNLNLDSCITSNEVSSLGQTTFFRRDAGIGGDLTTFTPLLANQISNPVVVSDIPTISFSEVCPPSVPSTQYSQSPYVYLQPAGSTGQDGSATGIHLRWMLKGVLGDNHLPKGNLASTAHNFNRSNDFVTIYRAPYNSLETDVNFSVAPNLIDDTNHLWVYKVNTTNLYINFKNATKYNQARTTIDPLTNSLAFIQAYGDGIIEVENKEELFFAIEINVQGISGTSILQTETLSVEDNKVAAQKHITIRKTHDTIAGLDNGARLVTDNIRSFRFKATDCFVDSFHIQLYSETIENIDNNNAWTNLGNFALTTDDNEAFTQLEPTPNLIHGKWQRYNDNAFVNTDNYQQKWSGNSNGDSIKEVIQTYISLSDTVGNPTAIETVNFSDTLPDGATQDSFDISNLYLLQVASLDFHVARMMGLGHLDLDPQLQTGEYIYLMEYFTSGDLGDGEGAREVRHLYMSTPVTIQNEKLPTPIDLKEPVLGLYTGTNSDEPVLQTDEFGYTEDGKTRYITLFNETIEDLFIDKGFYSDSIEFDLSSTTTPVYAGIEYKEQGQTSWRKPELSNTPDYQNEVAQGETPHNETVPITIPDPNVPLFIHREKTTGVYTYGSYGINWFSRTAQSAVTWDIETNIQPNSKLLPPSNTNPLLVVEEQPLLLTSANEQTMVNAIPTDDKTLIRLTFDYHHLQDTVSYKKTVESMGSFTDPLHPDAIFPDAQEILPEEIEIFFRDEVPQNISGKAKSISDDQNNELLSVIRTENYRLISTGGEIVPDISTAQMANFIGGVFILENSEFIIHEVEVSTITGEGPIFKVYKKEITDAIQTNTVPKANADLKSPAISADGLFMAIENMLNPSSWGTPNPHSLKVRIGNNWPIHREIIVQEGPDDIPEERLEKTRGIWDTALIEKEFELVGYDENNNNSPIMEHRGLYKATFNSTILNQHPQYNLSTQNPENNTNSVEWFKGVVRIHSTLNPNGSRRVLEAIKMEHIGDGQNLIVYFLDQSFPTIANSVYDEIQTGANIEVNYYPGYKVYLYADANTGITENTVLPALNEGVKYSIFGLRTVDTDATPNKYSDISIPKLMFAQEIVEPEIPKLPVDVKYATRPDTSGRATYTFTTEFTHTPYSMLYLRVNEHAILNALYEKTTIQQIKEELGIFAEEEFVAERWNNLLQFDYNYSDGFNENGRFSVFPVAQNGYRLPNPDRAILFNTNETPGTINPGNMLDRVKNAVFNAFAPLTEMPLIYEYIRDHRQTPYQPIAKKQVIRDRNGALLKSTDAEFDIAPMAKIVDDNKLLFTDFALDGTSDNLYFYAVREMGTTLKMGNFSPILGPVKLVNTKPAQTPEIKRVMPILENDILGIKPGIQFEINAYPKVQNIQKINIYRTLDPSNAMSLRTMDLIKVIEIDTAGLSLESVWTLKDEFEDLGFVPYGDPLYYRITVSRKVEYADKNGNIITEYAPSESSKLLMSNVVEVTNPIAPIVAYTFDEAVNDPSTINMVILKWDKTAHNATYHLFKMNTQGNWVKIHQVKSNEDEIQVLLAETNLLDGSLQLTNEEGNNIYHHFKVDVENSSGLFNTDEKVLTIPNDNAISVDTGVGSMIIGNTNIIR